MSDATARSAKDRREERMMEELQREQLQWLVDRARIGVYSGTHHMSTNHQITITGDTAASHSYLQAVHVRANPFDHWDAGGWYDCEYIRTSEGWKFTRVKLTAVWMTGTPDDGATKRAQ